MNIEKTKSCTRLVSRLGHMRLLLELLVGIMVVTLSAFLNFIKGCFGFAMFLIFEYILIHCGNDDDDTSGCLLLGDTQTQNNVSDGFVGASTQAYKRVYPNCQGT